MSDIARIIDAIIKNGLAPLLKMESFKKKGRNFYRQFENRTEVINVQASKWNEGNEGQFTVNLGVYYPEIAKITEDIPIRGSLPTEYNCTIRERIGFLNLQQKDAWWKIDSSTNESQVSADIANQVKTLCLPWLEEMSNLDNVKAATIKMNGYFLAAGIALFLGNREEASIFLEKTLKEYPHAKVKISDWAKKHGLLKLN